MNSSLQPDVRNEASNEIIHQYLSARKAREQLNWHPLFNLDQALETTIHWYKEFLKS
jgi:CDP-glucose 4,6-dehydratase